jgi:predicted DNA-binding ArsR family transcriptional regulator
MTITKKQNHSKLIIDLDGPDGNVFIVLSTVVRVLKEAIYVGVFSEEEVLESLNKILTVKEEDKEHFSFSNMYTLINANYTEIIKNINNDSLLGDMIEFQTSSPEQFQ